MSTAAMTREHTDLPDDAGTHRPSRGRRLVWVALALLLQIALVAVAVWYAIRTATSNSTLVTDIALTIQPPPDWSVVLQGTPILGGFEEKTIVPPNQTQVSVPSARKARLAAWFCTQGDGRKASKRCCRTPCGPTRRWSATSGPYGGYRLDE